MSKYEHKTERGALLAALEHERIHRYEWLVEGREVWRVGVGAWCIRRVAGGPVQYEDSFIAALRRIADEIN